MKTTTKFAIGIWITILAGGFGIASVGLFHIAGYIVEIGFAILAMIGVNLITSNSTPIIKLVPERRYKIINFSVTDTGEYTTLEYKNIYCKTIIHTFKDLNFEKRGEAGGFVVGYEPKVGRFLTACKEEGSDELVLKHI